MTSSKKTESQIFSFQDLTVWSTKLPDIDFAVLPPSNHRPNPLATEDRVYVSLFAPGTICALERDRGKLIWRRALGRYANTSVYLQDGRLFANTSTTLFVLQPDSGETLWSFCPYGTDGESIYSSPSARNDHVYIGDRRGYLHCLDAVSGRIVWKRHTNRARNSDVNSTPLLMDNLVIVTTNAKTVVAYDALSGKLAWKQKLDGPSTFGPLVHQDSVLAVSNSLYVLSSTGRIQRRLSWKNEKVYEADSTFQSIVLTFWPVSAQGQPAKLRLCTKLGVQRTITLGEFCPSFRYAPSTRLLYLSTVSGIDVLHAEKGTVLCQLKTSDGPRNGVALVDVRDRKIYALTGDGRVHALRHPASKFLGLA